MIGLVLGGARSGKSRYAQNVARSLTDAPVYLATSRRWDDDHAERIARHRSDRGPEWTTLEEETRIARSDLAGRVVVVDCVTLWLTNLFVDAKHDETATLTAAREQLEGLTKIDARFVLVSNELGMAPHAPTAMGRKFVDIQGFVNQHVARLAKAVTLMVAGIPMPVSGGSMMEAMRGERS